MKLLTSISKFSTALCVAGLAVGAQATLVIDQNQGINDVWMAGFFQPDLAQSFEQTNGNIAGAGIFLREGVGSSGTVNISLWDALPTNSGNQLASGSAFGTQGQWLDVFWAPVATPLNATLYLVFDSNDDLGIAGSTNNPYAFGNVFANSGYSAYAYFDYTFRTHYEDNQIAQVPEPSSLALLGLGILGVAVTRRKMQ